MLHGLDPQKTVLFVIDVQNDFCSRTGALAALGSDPTPAAKIAEEIAVALPKIRSLIQRIFFFRLVYDPTKMSAAQKERLLRDGKPILCSPEGDGTKLFRVSPEKDDIIIVKHRYGAFSAAELCDYLISNQIENIVVTGVDTHICVEGTIRQGYDLGYRMIMLSDLVSTRASELPAHEHSLFQCRKYYAIVTTSGNLLLHFSNRLNELRCGKKTAP